MMRPKTRKTPTKININNGQVRVGIVSCTHYGSKFQQKTYLKDFYQRCQDAKVQAVLHCGDLTEGANFMHRDAVHGLFIHTYQEMRDYVAENYPKINVPTYLISGNHDTSFIKSDSGNIVKDICEKRDDMVYMGDFQAYVTIGRLRFMIVHGYGGGSYSMSYKIQRLVDALTSENKPHVYAIGHWHRAFQMFHRNVLAMEIPCFQAQTSFLQSRQLNPTIGGYIIHIDTNIKGMGRIVSEFVPYFKPIYRDY